MDRTVQAALLTALVVGASLVGLGVFLGFPVAGSTWFGLLVGLLSGALLLAAGRRADSFHPTDDNAHLADHRPEPDVDDPPGPGSTSPSASEPTLASEQAAGTAERDAASDHPDQRPGA